MDVHREDPAAWRDDGQARAALRTLRDTLARTRYERVRLPGSLEEEVVLALERGAGRTEAEALWARGKEEVTTRLLDIEEFATLPILIRWTLRDGDPAIRRLAIDLVAGIADTWADDSGWDTSYRTDRFGYDPDGPPDARADARRLWIRWLKKTGIPYKGVIL